MYKVIKKSKASKARIGRLKTNHGILETPFFMPVATRGVAKYLSTEDLRKIGFKIMLSNTYHLMLRPGEDFVKKNGGLHKFCDWNGSILTDSGGFQVFSLAKGRNKNNESLVKLNKDGVEFKSYIDGKKYYLTPEKSLKIQCDLGVDIAVCLDECVSLPATKEYVEKSVELTSLWAEKSKKYHEKIKKTYYVEAHNYAPLLFAVIQGGLDKDLRLKSLKELVDIGFDGYNIGGLSVGESNDEMYKVLDYLMPEMPNNKPRYLMGVGYPENILEGVKRGVDMFDCVIPTREGRHGRLFIFKDNADTLIKNGLATKKINKGDFYKAINIKNSQFSKDKNPINKNSKFSELRNLSKAYLNYLFKIDEPLAERLASLNNIEFYFNLLEKIKKAI